MRQTKLIFLILLVVFFLTACGYQEAATKETEQEKLYGITVYTVDWPKVKSQMAIIGYVDITDADLKEIFLQSLEESVIEENTKVSHYQAREIVSYSETNVRFINLQDKEMFISGDYITITQRK